MSELSGISTIESFEMTSAICIFITFLCNVSFEFLFHVYLILIIRIFLKI